MWRESLSEVTDIKASRHIVVIIQEILARRPGKFKSRATVIQKFGRLLRCRQPATPINPAPAIQPATPPASLGAQRAFNPAPAPTRSAGIRPAQLSFVPRAFATAEYIN